jgi:RimJ/RimL family protein N-acetyltransferase
MERFEAHDEDDLLRLHQDPEVARTLGGKRTRPEVQAMVARLVAHWDERGFGVWTIRERDTGAFVGRGGLSAVTIEGRPEIEVLYALMPPFWGQGLATEFTAGSVECARTTLGLGEIIGYTTTGNIASQRVLENNGFGLEGEIFHAGLPHLLYRRTL